MNMNDQQQLTTPHSLEAEQAVLGALMRDNSAIDRIGDLEAKHFYREDHRAIFAEIVLLIARGQPADVMTVWPALEMRGGVPLDGLLAYLNQLQQSVPSAANVAQYAKTVVDRSTLRGVLWVADQITELAHQPKGKTVDQVLDAMQSMVGTLAERRVRSEARMVGAVLLEFLDGMTKRAEGLDSAMSTGIERLDRMMNGGLRPGQLLIIAGRPSMGKTAFSTDLGLAMAEQRSVLLFSMEMGAQEIAGRALANRGRVALSLVMGKIDDGDSDTWNRVSAGTSHLADMRFGIDDTAAITLLQLRMRAKEWKRKHGLDVIIVDYIGLMSGGEGDKRADQVGSYSRGLKQLAKELGVAVIALAQLNRKSEDRADRKPMLSDLRDSGEIEQDADCVMFVHRPEMHDPGNEALRGYAELLIRKQRSGALGDIALKFDGPTCRFSGWDGAPPAVAESKGTRRAQWDG
jgi:replicative DNA helicase